MKRGFLVLATLFLSVVAKGATYSGQAIFSTGCMDEKIINESNFKNRNPGEALIHFICGEMISQCDETLGRGACKVIGSSQTGFIVSDSTPSGSEICGPDQKLAYNQAFCAVGAN